MGTSQLDKVMQKINGIQKSTRIVTTPEELEALEREIRQLTDRLASLPLKQKLLASLDSEKMEQGEKTGERLPQAPEERGQEKGDDSHFVGFQH